MKKEEGDVLDRQGDREKHLRAVNTGSMRNITVGQLETLYDMLPDTISKRRLYIKMSCLAVLIFDEPHKKMTTEQLSELTKKYVMKRIWVSSQNVGSFLGMMVRLGVPHIHRENTYKNKLTNYWYCDGDEDCDICRENA
jgi:hypothetical protein